MVLQFREKGEDRLLFTRRTDRVLHHKGQICFPGGARDPADATLWETALRESREEIGLDGRSVTLIRELERQRTPSGFIVTPYLASIDPPFHWRPNPVEIAEIFSVALDHLRDPRNLRMVRRTFNDIQYLDPAFSFGPHEIWGMTGRVLCELLAIPIDR